jgi:Flp pilus assembly protein TadG
MVSLINQAPARGEEAESLQKGTDGAIMVIGAFMAMFLVGLLYFTVGIGETILFRERMQDASDAAAFSAAVMNARGMNLIALINMIMAAALAVLVALRAVELLCIAGIAVAGALAWVTGGASLAAIPPLTTLRNTVSSIYNSVKPVIDNILRVGHNAGVAVRRGMPFVAQGKAVITVMTAYRPPAQIGFVYPLPNRPLPTEDAPFSQLCDKAAEYVGAVIMIPLNPVLSLLGPVRRWVEGAVNSFTRAAAATVCGGSAEPPDLGVDLSKNLPESDLVRQCTQTGNRLTCNEAQAEQRAAQFDTESGYCRNNIPEGARQPQCRARLQQAQRQCRPGGTTRIREWTYQVEEMVVDVDLSRSPPAVGIPRQDPDFRGTNPHVVRTSRPLCGPGGSISTQYGPGGDESPICQPSNEDIKNMARAMAGGGPGSIVQVRYRRVLQVLGCKGEAETPELDFGSGVTGGSDKSPQQILRVNGEPVRMGDEEFQIRGFVIGNTDFDREYRGVQAANQWRDAGDSATGVFRTLALMGRFSVAQAEFYYAGSETDPDEWLWHMSWRARLRRFRMPPNLSGSDLESACGANAAMPGGGGGGACGSSRGLDLSFIERVVIH